MFDEFIGVLLYFKGEDGENFLSFSCTEPWYGYPKLSEVIFLGDQKIQILTVTTFWRGLESR
jgi:hypothetical protein